MEDLLAISAVAAGAISVAFVFHNLFRETMDENRIGVRNRPDPKTDPPVFKAVTNLITCKFCGSGLAKNEYGNCKRCGGPN